MKLSRRTIKASRACDDWFEDEAIWFNVGSAEVPGGAAPRFRSVSPAAHQAMSARTAPVIGFHRPAAKP